MNFDKKLTQKIERAENILKEYLPEESGYQSRLIEAMSYSVMAGGKRLRPILMEECLDRKSTRLNSSHMA